MIVFSHITIDILPFLPLKVAKHIVEARREKLARLLERHRYLSVPEVCAQLSISEATARRDLAALSQEERITRTHGGALPEFEQSFASLRERTRMARAAKTRIAEAAHQFLRPSMVCFLDGGTTMLALAQKLRDHPVGALTILTNNLAAADLLAKAEEIDVRLLGGRWLNRQSMLVGPEARRAIKTWRIDGAFFSAEGMDAQGLWNTQQEVIELQHDIQAKADRSWFCLDATKLGHATDHLLRPWSGVSTLITDASRNDLAAAHVSVNKDTCLHV